MGSEPRAAKQWRVNAQTTKGHEAAAKGSRTARRKGQRGHITVNDFARFRGLSMLKPFANAT